MWFLEDELRPCSKEEGVTMADSVETLGSVFENQSQEVGSERKSKKEEVQGEILVHQEEQGLPEELHEGGGQEVVTSGYGASEDVGSAVGLAPTERLKLRRQMAAAAGKKSRTSLSLFMQARGREVEEELSTFATQYWAEGAWI